MVDAGSSQVEVKSEPSGEYITNDTLRDNVGPCVLALFPLLEVTVRIQGVLRSFEQSRKVGFAEWLLLSDMRKLVLSFSTASGKV